ncbi:MAG: translation elongation factor Ts [Chitinophagales bacterium]|jgi:elongation factor Ts|nr:translation elongation factor Ts [Chitinophagales bacterium]
MLTAAEINKLRMQTGAGMMDCKKALEASNGDFDGAIDYLRKKGQKVAALRNDREAKEGAVIALTTADNKHGIVVCVNCETDFVAKNENFVAFARSIAQIALDKAPATLEDLLACDMDGISINDRISEQVGKIGEKISLSKYETASAECVVPYIHMGNKLGVLIAMNKNVGEAGINAGKDLTMQIAAMNPVAVDKDDVSAEVVEREMAIAREKAIADGKPEAMVEKIATGTVQKFFKEQTLVNQAYVKDGGKTVAEFLKSVDADLKVLSFNRVTLN